MAKEFISHKRFLTWKTMRISQNKHSCLFSSIVNDKTSFIRSMLFSFENNMHFAFQEQTL